jgi:hypothetical protein
MENILEQWKPVPGYEGLYEVSDQGKVRSLERWTAKGRGHRLIPSCIMKQVLVKGYLCVSLSKKKQKQLKVHRLVIEAFNGPAPEWATMVNHIDKNTLNNCLSNLEWSDNGHNKRHANRRFEYKGRLYSPIELAELAGTDVFLVSRRLRKGWSVKNAVEVPRRNTNNPKQLLGGQV